ncbi:MAG: Gfo/Idh/MocA family oxidoreductase [Lentisphaeria bacterium]|nr:Gfo/Idh/MocA family oxidoreductase [Lentisphaeria bacterium]
MKHKVAFAGFHHGHISALYKLLRNHPDWEISAACEEDPAAASYAEKTWGVTITHTDFKQMLCSAEFDILAIGDIFSLRGERAIDGLNAGKHILADKPLCTSLEELSVIRNLAGQKNLKIGMMLDLRHHKNIQTAANLIASGRIGNVQAIQFGGQHTLAYHSRPEWYFDPGKHGGTINDLSVHGLDAVEYLTGHKIVELTAARTWNAFVPQAPDFQDAAQFMVVLDNGCGVMGDVSYIKPEGLVSGEPFSWRFTLWGRNGVMEFSINSNVIMVYDAAGVHEISPDSTTVQKTYFEIFEAELQGIPQPFGTEHILAISGTALKLQKLSG